MKNVMPHDIDITKLEVLGIYELRNLARKLGIPRPTTMKRGELVEGIKNQIQSGGVAPIKKNTRGRKPRDITFDFTKIADDEDISSFYTTIIEEDGRNPSVRSGEIGDTTRPVSGFVHIMPRGHATLIGTDLNGYHITAKTILTYRLAMGDWLEGKATYDQNRQAFVIGEVFRINDTPPPTTPNYNRSTTPHFDTMESIRPKALHEAGDLKFRQGNKILISTPISFDKIEDIASKASKNFHSIALLAEETDDTSQYLIASGINNVFLAKINFNLKKQIMTCLLGLFRAKQLAEQGKDVLLFVDSFTKFFKIYNHSAFPEGRFTPNQINLGPLVDIKTFFQSAKALKKGGSLTIIAYINEPVDDTSTFLFNEFADMSNVLVKKSN